MKVGAYEAKTHLPSLLEKAAKGEHITITKHGVPVAALVPASETKPPTARTAEALRRFRRGRSLGELALRDLIDAGRR